MHNNIMWHYIPFLQSLDILWMGMNRSNCPTTSSMLAINRDHIHRSKVSGVVLKMSPNGACTRNTCTATCPITTTRKDQLRWIPLKTFRSPWTLRALTSFMICMNTNVLNMNVKCCEGKARSGWYFPSSISSSSGPANKSTSITVSW